MCSNHEKRRSKISWHTPFNIRILVHMFKHQYIHKNTIIFVYVFWENTQTFLMLLLWTPFFMFNFFLDFQSKASLKKKLFKITLLQCSTFFVYCVLGLLSILYTKNYFVRGVQRLFWCHFSSENIWKLEYWSDNNREWWKNVQLEILYSLFTVFQLFLRCALAT